MLKAEFAGEPAPDLVVLKTELVLTADAYSVAFAGQVADHGSFTVNESTEPKTLTLVGSAGPNEGRTIPCLFQLVGDRLRICYGLDGTLPLGFATRPDTQLYLATYRREPSA